jgi:Lrp/AsnC ligand binding domain
MINDRTTLEMFEQSVTEIPNILQAQRLFGDPDYLLRVITLDLATFQGRCKNRSRIPEWLTRTVQTATHAGLR